MAFIPHLWVLTDFLYQLICKWFTMKMNLKKPPGDSDRQKHFNYVSVYLEINIFGIFSLGDFFKLNIKKAKKLISYGSY